MKNTVKSFIGGMLVMSIVSGAAVIAADNWQTINVLPNTIKVVVGGKEIQADNFLYNDTTYLPIRAVSEALKMDVQYDNATSTATISEKKKEDNMAVTSKYTPPAEYINNNEYVEFENGVYYVLLAFIWEKAQDAGCKAVYQGDNDFIILKDDKEIYSGQTAPLKGAGGIPYDQFIEEIEPLLK